jgi:hypothetical protein
MTHASLSFPTFQDHHRDTEITEKKLVIGDLEFIIGHFGNNQLPMTNCQ